MKKLIGIVLVILALGMFLMLITHNRLIGIFLIMLLLFAGYNCIFGD